MSPENHFDRSKVFYPLVVHFVAGFTGCWISRLAEQSRPCTKRLRPAQRACEAERGGGDYHAGEDEVRPLHPPVVAEHQQAQRVPGQLEPITGGGQRDADDEVERPGDDALAEQRTGDRRRAIEPRGSRVLGHRCSSFLR